MLEQNRHHAFKLQFAYNKYGKDYFEFEVLEKCKYSLAMEREQFYLDKYNSFQKGYNSNPFSNQTTPEIQTKRVHKKWKDPKQRENQSKVAKKLWNNEEHRLRHAKATSAAQKKRWTKKARKEQSEIMKGNTYWRQR